MQPPNVRLQFGPYILDPAARQLLCNGVPVHLAPKSCDLLYLLLQNSGRVLGKEEILSSVWPGVTVEDGNLTQHISLLRKLLGTPPDGGQYIETLPKTGYRFLVPVSSLAHAPPHSRRTTYLVFFFLSAGIFFWLGRIVAPPSVGVVWVVPLPGQPPAPQIQAAVLDEGNLFPGYRSVLDAHPRLGPHDFLCRLRLLGQNGLEFELAAPGRPPCRYTGPAEPAAARQALHNCLHNPPSTEH